MMPLPIAARELRVAARHSRLYWGRVWAGLASLVASLYLLWLARQVAAGPGAGMFILQFTSFIVLAGCLFSGAKLTCDSLSAEKREETLGLLFLTHLKGYDVVLGKLAANSLRAAYLLIGVLPIISLPVLAGGVAGAQMFRIPVVLLNTLFLSLAIGMFVSSVTRQQRAAHLVSAGIIVVLAALLPAAAEYANRELGRPGLMLACQLFTPIYALHMAFNTSAGLTSNYFWTAILLQGGLAAAALAAACWIAPRSWQTAAPARAGGTVATVKARLHDWVYGTPEIRAARRLGLLARNPFLWLNCRARWEPLWPLLFAFGMFGFTLWAILHYEIPKEPTIVLLFAALGVIDLTVRLRVASVASARFVDDRQSGALELLLSSTLSVREILRGQWLAVCRKLLPVHLLVLACYAAAAVYFGNSMHGGENSDEGVLVLLFFALISTGDFITLGYVAMWRGMRAARAAQAPGTALLRVVLLPWMFWLTMMPVVDYLDLERWFDRHAPYSFLASALFVWGLSTFAALRAARRNLLLHFREAATDRFNFESRLSGRARLWMDYFREWIFLRSSPPSVLPSLGSDGER